MMQGNQDNPNAQSPNPLYAATKPIAYNVRTLLQFIVGLLIVVIIGMKLGLLLAGANYNVNYSYPNDWAIFSLIGSGSILFLVGQALAVSAAIELSYMLFTPGPDEAVDPLILGITSAALIVLSENNPHWEDAVVVFTFSISLFLLFHLRESNGEPPIKNGANGKLKTRVKQVMAGFSLVVIAMFVTAHLMQLPKTREPCLKIQAAKELPNMMLEKLQADGNQLCSGNLN